jgi:hypothetical protein
VLRGKRTDRVKLVSWDGTGVVCVVKMAARAPALVVLAAKNYSQIKSLHEVMEAIRNASLSCSTTAGATPRCAKR